MVDRDELPATLPIFPLSGALLLPRGNLPLNIFEPRYLAMVRDAMTGPRMIGMIQPSGDMPLSGERRVPVFDIGCAGKITAFQETDDGRFLITLSGMCRFRVDSELECDTPYRQVAVDYSGFDVDLGDEESGTIDRKLLLDALNLYLDSKGLSAEWESIEKAPDQALVDALATICPFEPAEKQMLLEAATLRGRADAMVAMMQIAAAGGEDDDDEDILRH